MITLTRLLAKRLRAVIRKALSLTSHTSGPPLVLEAGPDGLTIRAWTAEAAIEYRQEGSFPAECLVAPLALLIDCEGTSAASVTIEAAAKGRLLCQWQEKQVPLLTRYDVEKAPRTEFPPPPTQWQENGPTFLAALDEAMETADRHGVRYALHCIELRGNSGQIAATDGRQLLLASGGKFPWEEKVLVPRTAFFGCKELPADQPVAVGGRESWVAFRIGPWTIQLAIKKDGKFPEVEDQIRPVEEATTRLTISPADARFLAENLRHLPRDEDEDTQPVTLDLNGAVALRSKSAGQARVTELILANSRRTGDQAMIHMDRRYLARAVALGLTEFCVYAPDKPLLAWDERRRYVWMPLEPEGALPAEAEATVVRSPPETERPDAPPSTSRRTTAMPKKKRTAIASDSAVQQTNDAAPSGHPPQDEPTGAAPVADLPSLPNSQPATQPASDGPDRPANDPPKGAAPAAPGPARRRRASAEREAGPIEQALALRESLRGLLSQTNQLVSLLRRQKKQQRLMQATLASIKELQGV